MANARLQANVPYDIVMSMEEINEQFKDADLAICVGVRQLRHPFGTVSYAFGTVSYAFSQLYVRCLVLYCGFYTLPSAHVLDADRGSQSDVMTNLRMSSGLGHRQPGCGRRPGQPGIRDAHVPGVGGQELHRE